MFVTVLSFLVFIGPLFGHTTAYSVGQAVGTLSGVAASFVSGNVAACAGKIGMVAKVYNGVDMPPTNLVS